MISQLLSNIAEYQEKSLSFSEDLDNIHSLETSLYFDCFSQLLDFSESLDFAKIPNAPKPGYRVQQKNRVITCDATKTYACGKRCISQSKGCKNPIEGQAKTFTEFLKLHDNKSKKSVSKGIDKKDKTLDTGNNKDSKEGKQVDLKPLKSFDKSHVEHTLQHSLGILGEETIVLPENTRFNVNIVVSNKSDPLSVFEYAKQESLKYASAELQKFEGSYLDEDDHLVVTLSYKAVSQKSASSKEKGKPLREPDKTFDAAKANFYEVYKQIRKEQELKGVVAIGVNEVKERYRALTGTSQEDTDKFFDQLRKKDIYTVKEKDRELMQWGA